MSGQHNPKCDPQAGDVVRARGFTFRVDRVAPPVGLRKPWVFYARFPTETPAEGDEADQLVRVPLAHWRKQMERA